MMDQKSLFDLVPEQFKPLHPLEEKLIHAVQLGIVASDFPEGKLDMTQIGDAQIVRNDLLEWLLFTPEASRHIQKGIHLRGAKILGSINLEGREINQPLRFVECFIEDKMRLARGEFVLLDFSGSQTKSIDAYRIQIKHDFSMDGGFKAGGLVNLRCSVIGGNLDCSGGEFMGGGSVAILGDGIEVKGSIYLKSGFTAHGEIRLIGARIKGDLSCSGGKLSNGGFAFSGDRLYTGGSVFFREGFEADGEVSLVGAIIGNNLESDGAKFYNRGGYALTAYNLEIKGSIFLRYGMKADGEVNFSDSKVGGIITFEGSGIDNPDGVALNCERIETKGLVFLGNGFHALGGVNFRNAHLGNSLDCKNGRFEGCNELAFLGDGIITQGDVALCNQFRANGGVSFFGAKIVGNLDCDGGKFENHLGFALRGDGIEITGSVFCRRGFKALGSVTFVRGKIDCNFECDGGEFTNPQGIALSVNAAEIKGSIFLRNGFKADGEVNVSSVIVGLDLDCSGGEFRNANDVALSAYGITVGGSFYWCYLAKKPIGIVLLENATIRNLNDEENSWPEPGNLEIDGLVYGPFTSAVPADSKSRLRWLNLRNPNNLSVQPYQQLVEVFKKMGLQDDARDVAIAKQRAIRKNSNRISRLWSWILDVTISYGYKPGKVILFFIPIILVGIVVFNLSVQAMVIRTTDIEARESGGALTYEPFGYSLDAFLPIVDLHQETKWEVDLTKPFGYLVQYYFYIHILAGWFFTTLVVAAVTGIIRRE